MSTKKLAKELGLLRQRSKSSSDSKKSVVTNQMFSYLIVIDFESTCWRERNNYGQEIIEFPAVLLNTSTGEIESEFHTYVQPQEHPILSEFCTELTGITQIQVEAGVPLQICLSQFNRWLQNLQLEKGVIFPNKQQRCSAPSPSQKLCTFLTWSDWDLGVCLQYECKRKQLHKPDVLNSWIDLRSTYRLFYCRKPKGLNGALQDLGIQFSGREHSGLDDSRNTARLAARMMRDGCMMKITKSLERTPVVVKPIFGKTICAANTKKENPNMNEKENIPTTCKPSSSKTPHTARQKQPCAKNIIKNLDPKENSSSAQGSVQKCQSLISPKTLLIGSASSLWRPSRRSVTAEGAAHLSSVMKNSKLSHNSNINSLVLCSTTVNCFSNPATETETRSGLEDGEDLLVETEERCGSYDDVVLEEGDITDGTDREYGPEFIMDFDSGCFESKEPDDFNSPGELFATKRNCGGNNPKTHKITCDSSANYKPARTLRSHVNASCHLDEMVQHSSISESHTCFAVLKSFAHRKTEAKKPLQLQGRTDWPSKICKTNTSSSMMLKPFIPEKTSTPNTSFARPKPFIAQHSKHKESLKSSFTIYTEPTKQAKTSSRPSLGGSVLSFNDVTNRHSFTSRSSISATAKGVQRVTSPLCLCGRRAKRQVVSNGGPNHGRGFFCCPVRRSGGTNGRVEKGCQFFKWESALMQSCSVASPAVGSSVSLCQINSTRSIHLPHRSSLRKSY